MIHAGFLRLTGSALALLLHVLPLAAQVERDPTIAPAETGVRGPLPVAVEGMSVLLRGDRSYLVIGTRLYAPGDSVGNLRVARITETEVWFDDGAGVIKVPRFAGIERKTVITKPACAAVPAAPATTTPAESGGAYTPGKVKKTKKPASPDHPSLAPNPPPAGAPCEDTPS